LAGTHPLPERDGQGINFIIPPSPVSVKVKEIVVGRGGAYEGNMNVKEL